jgi:hypothetical protein
LNDFKEKLKNPLNFYGAEINDDNTSRSVIRNKIVNEL